tara:strand:+ start:1469 stop:2410 length:942 start_codon:yes stop_codon:yes gene_type:complete
MVHAILRERVEPQDINKPLLPHMAQKLLFEEYHRQPTEANFFQPIVGAIQSKHQVPLVHLIGENTQKSRLAEALVTRYISGVSFFSPKSLEIDATKLGSVEDLANEIATQVPHMNEFRKQFLLGQLIPYKPNIFKFATKPEDILKRFDIQEATPFQLDYLTINPYFTLHWDHEKPVLKFKSPFNETTHYTHTSLTQISSISHQNVFDAYAQNNKINIDKYGDTILNGDYGTQIVSAIYRTRRLPCPNIYTITFTPEETYKYDLKEKHIVPHTEKASGIAGILTHRVEDGVDVEIRREDRYFSKPEHTEILRHY